MKVKNIKFTEFLKEIGDKKILALCGYVTLGLLYKSYVKNCHNLEKSKPTKVHQRIIFFIKIMGRDEV